MISNLARVHGRTGKQPALGYHCFSTYADLGAFDTPYTSLRHRLQISNEFVQRLGGYESPMDSFFKVYDDSFFIKKDYLAEPLHLVGSEESVMHPCSLRYGDPIDKVSLTEDLLAELAKSRSLPSRSAFYIPFNRPVSTNPDLL